MILRLQLAVEAETPKYLAATANEAIAKILKGETEGSVVREERRAWFRVERASASEQPEQPEQPGPVAEPVADPPLEIPVVVVDEEVEEVEEPDEEPEQPAEEPEDQTTEEPGGEPWMR